MRFITGEEIVTVDGAIEHTFIEERTVLEGAAGRRDSRRRRCDLRLDPAKLPVDDAVLFIGRLSGGGLASFESNGWPPDTTTP